MTRREFLVGAVVSAVAAVSGQVPLRRYTPFDIDAMISEELARHDRLFMQTVNEIVLGN